MCVCCIRNMICCRLAIWINIINMVKLDRVYHAEKCRLIWVQFLMRKFVCAKRVPTALRGVHLVHIQRAQCVCVFSCRRCFIYTIPCAMKLEHKNHRMQFPTLFRFYFFAFFLSPTHGNNGDDECVLRMKRIVVQICEAFKRKCISFSSHLRGEH